MVEMTRTEALDVTIDVLELQQLTELARDGIAALGVLCGRTASVCNKTL